MSAVWWPLEDPFFSYSSTCSSTKVIVKFARASIYLYRFLPLHTAFPCIRSQHLWRASICKMSSMLVPCPDPTVRGWFVYLSFLTALFLFLACSGFGCMLYYFVSVLTVFRPHYFHQHQPFTCLSIKHSISPA
jgi:hypothetical protein